MAPLHMLDQKWEVTDELTGNRKLCTKTGCFFALFLFLKLFRQFNGFIGISFFKGTTSVPPSKTASPWNTSTAATFWVRTVDSQVSTARLALLRARSERTAALTFYVQRKMNHK